MNPNAPIPQPPWCDAAKAFCSSGKDKSGLNRWKSQEGACKDCWFACGDRTCMHGKKLK